MKAIRVHELGDPEVMQLQEVPDPQPSVREVLVQVKAIGVNPVDTYIRSGLFGKRPLPYTPGMDAAGIVEAIGDGVSRVKVGDRVYTADTISGAYAEKVLCHEQQVHSLPESISYAQGAAVPVPYATAYRALFHRAMAIPGEVVLIHGASGGVGVAAVQLAKASGMKIIGTMGTEEGRRLVTSQGADWVLDHHACDHLEEALALTDGRGVDVILEMLANVNLGRDLKILAARGRVVAIGSRGTVEIDPRDTMSRDASILGMSLINTSESENKSIHAALVAGLENGTLRPLVGQELALRQAPQAHRTVIEGSAYGKIVLIP